MSRLPAFVLAPIVLLQGRGLRRSIPRLAPATPSTGGSSATGARRLLVLGDSTAVGTGVEQMADAVAGQVARRLADPVAWRVVGANGLTSHQVRERHLDEALAQPADVIVLLVGWNDALRLRSAAAFATDTGALLAALRTRNPGARIALVAPPRFGEFAVLPQPLRSVMGAHVAGLTRAGQRLATQHSVAPVAGFGGVHTASDGFHPDAVGYGEMADGIVSALA